jgi:hypothetical protein
MRRRPRAPTYLGDEGGGVAAGRGGRGGDGGRVVALGVEEAGDRLVRGAGERVVEVELVVVLLPQLPLPGRHVPGGAAPARLEGKEAQPRRTRREARVVGFMRRGKPPLLRRSASTSSVWLGDGL